MIGKLFVSDENHILIALEQKVFDSLWKWCESDVIEDLECLGEAFADDFINPLREVDVFFGVFLGFFAREQGDLALFLGFKSDV